MSFRANVVSRGIFPSSKFYLMVVHYPTWWIPPLRLRCGRNDKRGYVSTNSPIVSGMFQAAPLPHQSGLRPASFPGGEAFVPGFGVSGVIGNGSVLSRAERHIGRSLRFRWWAGVFNRGVLWTGGVAVRIVGTTGAKGPRPSTKNCQLSIVNRQFRNNCQLSYRSSLPFSQMHILLFPAINGRTQKF